MKLLKQSTAVTVKWGPFVDASDGDTAMTGLTIQKADVRVSKNGGNMAAANADQGASDAGAPHDEIGVYDGALNTTDTDTLGRLRVDIHESGALHVWDEYLVVPANIYDSWVAGSDFQQIDVAQFGGSNGTFASGRPEVNASHAAGTAWNSGAITANTFAADAITAAKLASDVGTEIAAAVWAFVVDGTRTAVELMRGFAAVLLGPSSGLDTGNPVYRNIADTKDVVDATSDADGNRSSVTLDLT